MCFVRLALLRPARLSASGVWRCALPSEASQAHAKQQGWATLLWWLRGWVEALGMQHIQLHVSLRMSFCSLSHVYVLSNMFLSHFLHPMCVTVWRCVYIYIHIQFLFIPYVNWLPDTHNCKGITVGCVAQLQHICTYVCFGLKFPMRAYALISNIFFSDILVKFVSWHPKP